MKKTRILPACLLALVTVLFALTACTDIGVPKETEHTHTFDENWLYDDADHWHPSICEHEDEVSDKAAHVDEDGNDVCDVCSYRKAHEHAYEDKWTQGPDTHYYKNICGHDDVEKYRRDEAAHEDKNNDSLCDVCAYDYGHTHTYAEEWTKTDGGHWHAPTCGHDVPGSDLTDHADENNDGICEGCAYDYDHTHTFEETWTTDDNSHWHKPSCGHDIPVTDKGAHADADKDGACDICTLQIAHYHDFESAWSSDASGHWHKSTCHPDDPAVRDAEAPHNGYDADGICDTCGYTVFHIYTVTVTLPDDSLSVTAPDGSNAGSFELKEGTDATFTVTMPTRLLLVTATGASIEGKPAKSEDGLNHTYTLKITAIGGDTEVALTIDKTANVEVIISDGKQEMEITKSWTQVTGTLTVHVPASGHYIIYSSTHPGLMGVTFTLEGNTVKQDDSSISYAFETDGACDLTFNYSYFPMSVPEGGKETFTYVVAKIDPTKTLPDLTGTGYTMPTNATVQITFTVPAPGLYQISSSYPVAWDADVTTPHVFLVEEGKLTQTMTMQYNTETAATFPFDWKIEQFVTPVPVTSGETPITAPLKDYVGITFTADKDGSYYFGLSEPDMMFYHWYVSDYGNSMNALDQTYIAEDLKAGDTVTLYVRVNMYNSDITADISGTLTVAYTPAKTDGGYMVTPGTQNVYSHNDWEDSEYMVSVPAGAEISVDGGATWHSSLTVEVKGYGMFSYIVRTSDGSAAVKVIIEEITFEYTLGIGVNTITMTPGAEYTLSLSGSASPNYYLSYMLSWTDPALTVTYGGAPLTSGMLIERYDPNSSTVTVIYNGSAMTAVSFTLEDAFVPPVSDLAVGANALHVINGYFGDEFVFVAPEAGYYTFSYAAGEQNGFAMSGVTAEELKFPYTVYLSKYESFILVMATADSLSPSAAMQDVIDIVISVQ